MSNSICQRKPHYAIFLLLLSFSVCGQTWKFKHVDSDFDGSYSVIYAKGSGGGFPYESPSFYINNIKGGLNVYIHGLGYTGNDGNRLIFIFDGNRRYELASDLVSASADSESLFIYGVQRENQTEPLSVYYLLDEIAKSSKMAVRFDNKYDRNTFVYRLNGSSSALNKMFSNGGVASKIRKIEREEAISDSIKVFSDSVNRYNHIAWQKRQASNHKIVNEQVVRMDSIFLFFLRNNKIGNRTLSNCLSPEDKEYLRIFLSEKISELSHQEKFLRFSIIRVAGGSGYYKIMLMYMDESNRIKEKYIYKALTPKGRLV